MTNTIKVKDKAKFIEGLAKSAQEDAKSIINNQLAQIDRYLDNVNARAGFLTSAGGVLFALWRGCINGVVDSINGLVALGNNIANTITHMFDSEDGTNFLADLGIGAYDIIEQTMAGLSSGVVGMFADVGKAFGADDSWAYGEGMALDQLSNFFKTGKAGVITALSDKEAQDKYLSMAPQEVIEARRSPDTAFGMSYQKFDQNIKDFSKSVGWVKENIVAPATFRDYFAEKLQNEDWYSPVSSAVESIGRLVPIIVFGHLGSKVSYLKPHLSTISQAYFASSVAGSAIEEALGNGVSFDDAFTYALGSAASELLVENLLGIKLSEAMTVKSGGKVLQNILEEAAEELIQEFGERGLSYYATPGRDITPETSKDIWSRVAFSAMVGGIGGGAMSGLSLGLYSTTAESKITSIQEIERMNVEKFGLEKATDLFKKRTENLLKVFQGDKYSVEQKAQFFKDNATVRGLVAQNQDGTYTLTAKGEAFMRGDILAKQGAKTISKDTHAVGGDSYGLRYKTQVEDSKGKAHKIDILDNEKVTKLDKNKQQTIDFAKRNNLDIAFVETGANNDTSFFNGFTAEGVVYVNVNSDLDMGSIIVHELHDKISALAKSKMLTDKQYKAWNEFQEFVLNEADGILKALGKKFDFSFYEAITASLPKDIRESILTQEKVSAFIQQVFSNQEILNAVFDSKPSLFQNFSSILNSKMTRENVLKKVANADTKVFEDKLIKMNRMLAKIIKDTQSVLKAQPRISEPSDLQTEVQRTYFSAREVSKEGYIDTAQEAKVEKTITPFTETKFDNNFFEANKRVYKQATQEVYRSLEDTYSTQEESLGKEKNNIVDKMNSVLKNFINRTPNEKNVYNHFSSAVGKRVILEFQHFTKNKPSQAQLVEIAENVNITIFSALDYVDAEFKVETNKKKGNPNGYLYNRELNWYLRNMKEVDTFTESEYQRFNNDPKGEAYRRLINSILNYNNNDVNGDAELINAIKHWGYMTDVESKVDLVLHEDTNDKSHPSISQVASQWGTNGKNIRDLKEQSGFQGKIDSAMDLPTVGGIVGLFDTNSWSHVLTGKLVQAAERQIEVKRVFDKIFTVDNWASKNKKALRVLDTKKVMVKQLGIEIPQSQIITLRNMIVREIVQNKAIDLKLIKGEKTNRFKNGFEVDILAITENTQAKKGDKQRTAVIKNVNKLVAELDNIINADSFLVDYNNKVLKFFDECYSFINERYKEKNGLILKNFGRELEMKLKEMGDLSFLEQLPIQLTLDNIRYIYTPFLSDSSGYFDADKLDLKRIMDLGVFEGMTKALTDTTARAKVESMNFIVNSYLKHTANYYGVERVMRDFDLILNQRLAGHDQVTYVNRFIPKEATEYYKNALLDVAGYKPASKTPGFKRLLGFLRRSFYKATLGLNIKVITTQFATLNNLTIIYGEGKFDFYTKMLKNFAAQHTTANKEKIKWLLDNNNFMLDRADRGSFDLGEATKPGFATTNAINEFTEKMMLGIRFTDSSINFSFFLTLLDTINPQTNALYTMEEASNMVTQGILRSQSSALNVSKSALLRTDNEVLKIFLKFLGEPLKLYTQFRHDFSRVNLVKKLKASQEQISEQGKKDIKVAKSKLEEATKAREAIEKKENSRSFNDLSEEKQKEIRKEIKEAEKEEKSAKAEVYRVEDMIDKRNFLVETLIGNEALYKKQLRQKATAILVTISYLSFLSTVFSLVRGGFGKKDKPEDQEFAEYLAKLVGKNFFESMFSMLPGVRDIYQLTAQGYGITDIDEMGALDDLGRSLNYFMRDVIAGNEIKWGKTGRIGLGALGQILGVPVRGLERLFTTPMLYIDETVWYKYHKFIGRQTRDNVELARAIKENNLPMIEAIIDNKIASRKIEVSKPIYNEMVRLASKNQEVKITGVSNKVTIDGETVIMTSKQLFEFKQVYKNADFIAQKILYSGQYRRLNDNNKRSLITSIYNYYLRKAKQDVLGADLIPQANYFRTLNQAYAYFTKTAESLYNKQLKDKKGAR